MSEISPEPVPVVPPAPVLTPAATPKEGTSMDVSHVSGGGFGVIVGAAIVGILRRYAHVDVSTVDSAVVGSAALAAGVGFGHIVSRVGVLGFGRILLRGNK